MTALRARRMVLSFGPKTVLKDIEVSIEPGQLVSLIGPNAAGKSSLVEVLAGLRSPTRGVVMLGDRPLTELPSAELARLRAYLPATAGRRVSFTTREVVTMGTHPWRAERSSPSTVDSLLEELQLEAVSDSPLSSLSTGEARRAHLARVLAQDTPVFLLDEPTSNLDLIQTRQAHLLLRRMTTAGATVLFSTHDLAAASAADRILVLDDGMLVGDGEPRSVLTEELLTSAYRTPVGVVEHPFNSGLVVDALDPGNERPTEQLPTPDTPRR